MEKNDILVGKITQDEMNKRWRHSYDAAKSISAPKEHLELIKMEATGGDCPRCGKPWKEIRVNNMFGEFVYYDPDCKCFGRCQHIDYGGGACRASWHREESAGITVSQCPSCGWDVNPVFGRVCRDCGEGYTTMIRNTYKGLCPTCKKKKTKNKEGLERIS